MSYHAVTLNDPKPPISSPTLGHQTSIGAPNQNESGPEIWMGEVKVVFLFDQLEQYDSESEEAIEVLLPQAQGTPQAGALGRVHRSIAAYELDEAAEQLQLIIEELKESDSN